MLAIAAFNGSRIFIKWCLLKNKCHFFILSLEYSGMPLFKGKLQWKTLPCPLPKLSLSTPLALPFLIFNISNNLCLFGRKHLYI